MRDGVAADAAAERATNVLTRRSGEWRGTAEDCALRRAEEHEPPVRHHGAVHMARRRNQRSGMSVARLQTSRLARIPAKGVSEQRTQTSGGEDAEPRTFLGGRYVSRWRADRLHAVRAAQKLDVGTTCFMRPQLT